METRKRDEMSRWTSLVKHAILAFSLFTLGHRLDDLRAQSVDPIAEIQRLQKYRLMGRDEVVRTFFPQDQIDSVFKDIQSAGKEPMWVTTGDEICIGFRKGRVLYFLKYFGYIPRNEPAVRFSDLRKQLGEPDMVASTSRSWGEDEAIYFERGIAFYGSTDGDYCAWIEVFPPMSKGYYMKHIYRDPKKVPGGMMR